jgi:hypothetical protein
LVEALHSLAALYVGSTRIEEARKFGVGAYAIFEPLWRKQPELHGNQMARILSLRALLAERKDEACDYARRGFGAASDPALKKTLQIFLDQYCPEIKLGDTSPPFLA